MDKMKLIWGDVDKICRQLAKKVKRKFKPDLILAVSRGGLIPGRLLSEHLNNKNITALRIAFYKSPGSTFKKPKVLEELKTAVRKKRILVVDDVTESGKTLILVKHYLEERGAKEVKFATMFHKMKSKIKPDFYIRITDKWIVYPWEKS